MSKKVALFFYEYRDLDTYPYITNTIKILAEQGYFFDVYLNSAQKNNITIDNTNFIIVSKVDDSEYIINSTNYIKENNLKYDFIFAYTTEGLVISLLLNKKNDKIIPTIYFSMELDYQNLLIRSFLYALYFLIRFRFSPFMRWFFRFYLMLNSLKMRSIIKFSVIMDENRAKILKKQFKFVERVLYLPNSYIGFSNTSSDFAYKRFNIPDNKKIILFSGGLSNLEICKALENMLDQLSSDYILFLNIHTIINIHTFDDSLFTEKINEIKEIFKEKIKNNMVYINSQNLQEDEYTSLVKSSFIGLAWYQIPESDNMYFLGYSSGRLNSYLSCGKPVIAPSYFYKYDEFIELNHLGKVCDNIDQIPLCINYICDNYEFIQGQIEEFYLKNLEFKQQFIPVFEELEK